MKKMLLLITSILLITGLNAQPLAAYHNYQQHFVVFDNGTTVSVENLPVKSYQIGKNCVAWVANSGLFKVYYKGETKTLATSGVERYYTTRNLLFYFVYNQLYVFDKGNAQMLSSNVRSFAIGDELVAFYNENKRAPYVYYHGELQEIESSLIGAPISRFVAGDNVFAYFNDNTKYLKVFYDGDVQNVLQSNGQVFYKAGRNIVAYVDNSQNSFHVFYKGEVFDLEDFRPKSFKVGKDVLAYVDNTGSFKVFSDGEVQTISSFEPDVYDIQDELVVFTELEYFKVFYKNDVYELESYTPNNFQVKDGAMAYINVNGWLKAFINGKQVVVSKDLIRSFVLTYDLVLANTSGNTVKIFYKDKFGK